MTETIVYLIDPYVGEPRPTELPIDFIALVDEGLMVEAVRLNETDVIYAVEHHVVQRYWRIPGLTIYGPGCLIGRSKSGGFLERPTMTIEMLACDVEFGCLPEPIRLETSFHPWLKRPGTKLTQRSNRK
jgi:hypothetical protein